MTDMQPENINLPKVPEVNPNIPKPNMDRLPPLPGVEAGPVVGGERYEQVAELSAAQSDATSAAVATTVLAQPTAVYDTTFTDTTTTSPLTAAHEDLIEKEWVDKAKDIITSTLDDPHARGQQVSALQKDYLRKRYGKELGAAS